ncbi:MAG TPA: FHA domain-containing serine/threonine-protein kinase [Candidatus Brocadiia bacterium]|nr:FHA domain-containing serine/threonine-protein kinase [Candidatus Brocadiia bacterium]
MPPKPPIDGWTDNPAVIQALVQAFPRRGLRVVLSRLLTTAQIQDCVNATLDRVAASQKAALWDLAVEKGYVNKQQIDMELTALPSSSEDPATEAGEAITSLSRKLTKDQLAEALTAQLALARFGIDKSLWDIAEAKGFIIPTKKQDRSVLDTDTAQVDVPKTDSGPPVVPGYEIMEAIGKGGMSTVYKARQLSMDRIVALKILEEDRVKAEGFVQRFAKEARLAAGLNHPNIVMAIDYGRAGINYYFVMEFVDGEAVSSIIRRKGRLKEKAALYITAQVARALEHARQHGLIHRDIKPGNILITKNGVVKLADLGLAKKIETRSDQEGDATSLTDAMVAVGTPQYISPEQAKGLENIDTRADIYSLGITLFTMLSGAFPFDGPPMEVIAKQITEPVPSIKSIVPSVSERTNSIVKKMTVKMPEKRYQTPHELVGDLMEALEAVSQDRARPFWLEDQNGFPEPLVGIFEDTNVVRGTDFAVYEEGADAEFNVEQQDPVVERPEDFDELGTKRRPEHQSNIAQSIPDAPAPPHQAEAADADLMIEPDESATIHSPEEFPDHDAENTATESRTDGLDTQLDDLFADIESEAPAATPYGQAKGPRVIQPDAPGSNNPADESDESEFSSAIGGFSGVMDQLRPEDMPAIDITQDPNTVPRKKANEHSLDDSDSGTGISDLIAGLKADDTKPVVEEPPSRRTFTQPKPFRPLQQQPGPGQQPRAAAPVRRPASAVQPRTPIPEARRAPSAQRPPSRIQSPDRQRQQPLSKSLEDDDDFAFDESKLYTPDTGGGSGARSAHDFMDEFESLEGEPAQPAVAREAYTVEAVRGLHAGQKFTVAEGEEIVLGRDKRWSDLVLDDPRVSRYHCHFSCRQGALILQDQRSHNGTFVNGHKVQNCTLREGDEIRVGKTTFIISRQVEDAR